MGRMILMKLIQTLPIFSFCKRSINLTLAMILLASQICERARIPADAVDISQGDLKSLLDGA